MSNSNDSRTESSSPVRTLAAALFVVMVASGYALSTQVEAVPQSNPQLPAVAAAQAATPYFPAQFVNQAKEVEDHIQAY
jgi:hypothetical protein